MDNLQTTSTTPTPTGYISLTGEEITGFYSWNAEIKKDAKGYHPLLVFKYTKSKFSMLEKLSIDRRIQKLEKAFYQAVDNGQNRLGEKIMNELAREARETILYAKNYSIFIEKEDLNRHKNRIKGGHISDTSFGNYTRVIPKDVLDKKKKAEPYFDNFVIYHYWNNAAEEKLEKKQKISPEEKAAMKDPILFGIIKEAPDKLYFIADWEDEYCDLTFDEIIDVVGENRLTKYPNLEE